MEILIVYHSKTGRTKELAEEIANGVREVEGANSILKTAAEVTNEDFVSAAGVIAGSPVYFGSMAAELKAVFDRVIAVRKKLGGKVGAAFATSAFHAGGKETTQMSIIQALLICGMIVVGDPLDASGHYGVSCTGAMDGETADFARKLGRRVARLAAAVQSAAHGEAL
jgi:NAD(P)H dehydrogenase (quinone)